MNPQNKIIDRQQYQKTAAHFFNILFAKSFESDCGEIEIRGFENGPRLQSYHGNIPDAVKVAYQACQQGYDVYIGVNPRIGQAGGKDNAHYLVSFHAEIDYGKAGHKKASYYATYNDALSAIMAFEIPPTIVILQS
jgi:putative DNA primase/helicase